MDHQDPSLAWQLDIHERIAARHRTAFAELCERVLDSLLSALRVTFASFAEDSLLESALHDALLDYAKHPDSYDPSRGALLPYLRMKARDDVRNELAKRRRRLRRIEAFDDRSVDLIDPDGYIEQEYFDLGDWIAEYTDLTLEMVVAGLREELDETEMSAFMLMLDGVRETEQYASLLGAEHLDVETQRREVKRLKDRIKKRVERYGKRIRRDE